MNEKREEYQEHWDDDLHAARGVFGLPLIAGCIFAVLAAWCAYLNRYG